MNKQTILDTIRHTGTVAIIRKIGKEHLPKVAEALYLGGVKLIEVTCNTPGYIEMIEMLRRDWDGKLIIGAGTVLSPELAEEVIAAGADFLLAPNLDADVVKVADRHNKLPIPGVATPTEIVQASKLGIGLVKLFPAGSLGPRYLKDLRGPLGHIEYMPVGGINKENMVDFLKVGACAFGFGGELVDGKLISEGRFDEIQSRAKQIINIFADFKRSLE